MRQNLIELRCNRCRATDIVDQKGLSRWGDLDVTGPRHDHDVPRREENNVDLCPGCIAAFWLWYDQFVHRAKEEDDDELPAA